MGALVLLGVTAKIGCNVVMDAFGVVALVALAPLIAIQVMGLLYMRKSKSSVLVPEKPLLDDTIVDLEEEL